MSRSNSRYWTPSDDAVEEAKEKVIEITRGMSPVLREWMPDPDENMPDWILDLPPDLTRSWTVLIKALGELQTSHGLR